MQKNLDFCKKVVFYERTPPVCLHRQPPRRWGLWQYGQLSGFAKGSLSEGAGSPNGRTGGVCPVGCCKPMVFATPCRGGYQPPPAQSASSGCLCARSTYSSTPTGRMRSSGYFLKSGVTGGSSRPYGCGGNHAPTATNGVHPLSLASLSSFPPGEAKNGNRELVPFNELLTSVSFWAAAPLGSPSWRPLQWRGGHRACAIPCAALINYLSKSIIKGELNHEN